MLRLASLPQRVRFVVGVLVDLTADVRGGLAACLSVGFPLGLLVGFSLSLAVVFPDSFAGRLAALLPEEANRNKGLSMRVGVDGGFWSGIDRFLRAGGFPGTGLVSGCCKGHIRNYGKTQEKHIRNCNGNLRSGHHALGGYDRYAART